MINQIKIEKFKAVQEICLDLDRFNILVGSNNSGKSSVLQAVQFAVGTAQTANRLANRLVNSLSKKTISFSANAAQFSYLPIKDFEALVYDRNLTQTQGSSVTFFEENASTSIRIKRGKNRNISASMDQSVLLNKLMSTVPYCVIIPGVSGISISEEFKTKAFVNKSATRGDSNLYLRNILLLLNHKKESWASFIDEFQTFFPEYELHVEFNEATDETIDAYVMISDRIKLPIDALGTSALQIMQILSYIYCFDPQMLILDEPDTHLHPNNQRKLISVLNKISIEQNMQILLSTHSRHMIDEASNLASFFWMQNGHLYEKLSDQQDLEYVQMLLDLGALDKSEFMQNQNIKWVICTEDERTEKDEMLKSILLSSGFDLSECVILPYNGCSKIESAVLLNSFIQRSHPIKMIVHRDSDYLSEEELQDINEKLKDKGITMWCTPGTDVESIFVNSEHIHSLYPDLNIDAIDEMVRLAKEATKEDSIKKFVNYVANSPNNRDYRGINNYCEAAYNANPDRYFYGKKTLGILKSKIQASIHANPNLYQHTEALKQENLQLLLRD